MESESIYVLVKKKIKKFSEKASTIGLNDS